MSEPRRNPFPVLDATGRTTGWKWLDETDQECSITYPTQAAALKDLVSYCHFLEFGPTFVQKLWWPVRYVLWPKIIAFWKDQTFKVMGP